MGRRAGAPRCFLSDSFASIALIAADCSPALGFPSTTPARCPNSSVCCPIVVGDEPDARDILQRVLEAQQARVEVHDSSNSALEALQHRKPHLIVSDIGMPEIDGYQFMRLRARNQQVSALRLWQSPRSPAQRIENERYLLGIRRTSQSLLMW